jgi:hypothetical protein
MSVRALTVDDVNHLAAKPIFRLIVLSNDLRRWVRKIYLSLVNLQ